MRPVSPRIARADLMNRAVRSSGSARAPSGDRCVGLAPLHDLIRGIVRRGIDAGDFHSGVEVDTTSALILQSVLGAM
ncbi:TetR/AcrR family transcriptional regulator, partial [Mycolicibacterium smegmatis]|nr:TetR/AcrR family transcriptional regulator [Mycolicibacterium smegmatis]